VLTRRAMRVMLSLLLVALVSAVALVAVDGQASGEDPSTATPEAALPSEGAEAAGRWECVPDQILVKIRPGADPAVVSARHGATFTGAIVGLDVHVLTIPAGAVAEKVAAFSADPDVVYAEPNGVARVPEQPPGATQPCGVTPAPGG
jgi:hypothetical protein